MSSAWAAHQAAHQAESVDIMQVSRRAQATDAPVIGKTKALIAGVQGVRSLAQGEELVLVCLQDESSMPRTSSR